MPLAWAHAEYIKLLRSLHEGAVWDRVPQTEDRYLNRRHAASFQIWTPKQRRGWLTSGKDLRLDLVSPSRVTWRIGRNKQSAETTDTGLGLHCATLPLGEISGGTAVHITTQPLDHKGSQKPDSFALRVRE
jgi:glucoamylase